MNPTVFPTVSKKILLAYNRSCEPLLEKYGIHQASFDILMFLTNNPEYPTAQQISEIRHIKKKLVSVHVEKLVNVGLLQRDTVHGDRRKIALSCTEKAQPIVEEGRKMQAEFFKKLTADIDPELWKAFETINVQIAENAEKILKNNP